MEELNIIVEDNSTGTVDVTSVLAEAAEPIVTTEATADIASVAETDGTNVAARDSSYGLQTIRNKDERTETTEEQDNFEIILNQVSVSKSLQDLADLVPQKERAADSDRATSALSEARKKGYFSPAARMARIDHVLNGRIYAAINVDAKGIRHFQFCQQYADGTYSEAMSIPQADLIRLWQCGFSEEGTDKPQMKRKVRKILDRLWDEYLGKIELDEPVDLGLALRAIYKVRGSLPIYDAGEAESREMFYRQTVAVLQGKMRSNNIISLFSTNSYYTLDMDAMKELASHLGMNRTVLVRKLNEFGFLYIQESVEESGYQAKIRIGSGINDTENFYCIFKIENLVKKSL